MIFENTVVPGANWVEIVKITKKDGSPLSQDNWRNRLFGRISLCWIAGGFEKRGAFFKFALRMEHGKVMEMDLGKATWCSTTTAQPIETEPGNFELETNTSLYHFRLLSQAEVEQVYTAIAHFLRREMFEKQEQFPVSSTNGIVS